MINIFKMKNTTVSQEIPIKEYIIHEIIEDLKYIVINHHKSNQKNTTINLFKTNDKKKLLPIKNPSI
jgi:hypothetical protein